MRPRSLSLPVEGQPSRISGERENGLLAEVDLVALIELVFQEVTSRSRNNALYAVALDGDDTDTNRIQVVKRVLLRIDDDLVARLQLSVPRRSGGPIAHFSNGLELSVSEHGISFYLAFRTRVLRSGLVVRFRGNYSQSAERVAESTEPREAPAEGDWPI